MKKWLSQPLLLFVKARSRGRGVHDFCGRCGARLTRSLVRENDARLGRLIRDSEGGRVDAAADLTADDARHELVVGAERAVLDAGLGAVRSDVTGLGLGVAGVEVDVVATTQVLRDLDRGEGRLGDVFGLDVVRAETVGDGGLFGGDAESQGEEEGQHGALAPEWEESSLKIHQKFTFVKVDRIKY